MPVFRNVTYVRNEARETPRFGKFAGSVLARLEMLENLGFEISSPLCMEEKRFCPGLPRTDFAITVGASPWCCQTGPTLGGIWQPETAQKKTLTVVAMSVLFGGSR